MSSARSDCLIVVTLNPVSPVRQECGMLVDAVEEEIPGELENICSDDGELRLIL